MKNLDKKIEQLMWEVQLMQELILGNDLPKEVIKAYKKAIKEMNKAFNETT